jgi:ribosomal protein L37AE/L43A
MNCPDCNNGLRGDGSCCDYCGWTLVGGGDDPRLPSGRTPFEIEQAKNQRCTSMVNRYLQKTAPRQTAAPLSDKMLEHVRSCLAILQEAQDLCNTAAQELCPVPGFADQWSKLSAPYDAVKAAWYLVHNRLEQMRIRAERGQCPACGKKLARGAKRCEHCDFEMP